jgi:methionine-rich copper-binding protein CopC
VTKKVGVAPDVTTEAREDLPIQRPAGGVTAKGMIIMTSFTLIGAALAAASLGMISPPASARPKVIAAQPGEGAHIAPGPFVLRVTFDRPMRTGSYSFVTIDDGSYPDCAKTPRQSADRKTFTLDCAAAPGGVYAVGINGGRFWNFTDAQTGSPAEPTILRFAVR